jgi:hypothetical protein
MSTSITTINANILCIPGVFANIGEERIRRAFADLDIGELTRVDIVTPKSDINNAAPSNKKFNRVFIHIVWNDSKQAAGAKEKLSQGKEIKIIYDEPWFWKVSAYKKTEKVKVEPKHKKATLELDEEKCDSGHSVPKNANCLECIWMLEQEAHRQSYQSKKTPIQSTEKSQKKKESQEAGQEAAAAVNPLDSVEPWKLSTVSSSGDVKFPHFKRPRGKIIIAPAL